MRFCLCPTCATGYIDGDWSVLSDEFDELDAAEEEDRRSAVLDSLPNVTATDDAVGGYGDCFACDEVVVDPHIFTYGE